MSTVTFDRPTDVVWKRLLIATKTGVFPFSKGDTVGWDEMRHRAFVNVGTVIRISPPHIVGKGGYCLEDGVYNLLGSTQVGDFRISVKPKFKSSAQHVETEFNGNNILKLRSARMVLIEKVKKTDIYKNNG